MKVDPLTFLGIHVGKCTCIVCPWIYYIAPIFFRYIQDFMNEQDSYQIRNLQVNPYIHTALVSLPSKYVRVLRLSKGDRMKISLIEDVQSSRIVVEKARVS